MILANFSLSPLSEGYLSEGTDNNSPFILERYRPHFEQDSPSPSPPPRQRYSHPLRQPPMTNMEVDGTGLRALNEITTKAEKAADEILREVTSSRFSKIKKCLVSGEARPFIDALYELEDKIARIAEEVRNDEDLFQSIEPHRTKAAYKLLCKAMRGLSLALSNMTTQCGQDKYIRVCRKFVVRVLQRIRCQYAKLVYGMERVVERVWAGPQRYGDDVNAGSLLKSRIQDWLNLEPRFMDKLLCNAPDRIIRRGQRVTEEI